MLLVMSGFKDAVFCKGARERVAGREGEIVAAVGIARELVENQEQSEGFLRGIGKSDDLVRAEFSDLFNYRLIFPEKLGSDGGNMEGDTCMSYRILRLP